MKGPIMRLEVKMPNGERMFAQPFTEDEAGKWLLHAVAYATGMMGSAVRHVEVLVYDYRPEDER